MFFDRQTKAQSSLEGVRRPLYAGSWYDADGGRLRAQLAEFLAVAQPTVDAESAAVLSADNRPVTDPILAIVVPHAGYVFSGQAAAHAYKAVQDQPVSRVFLMGPSHHVGFHGAALPAAGTFATPVGDLEVAADVVSELKEYPIFKTLPEVHRVEHSLEMQLPFIREALGPVKIVPIVVGALSDDAEIRLCAAILKRYVRAGDLVVVSSDFTHYGPRYDYQPFAQNISEKVRSLDGQAFEHLSRLDLDGFLEFQQQTKDTICGFYPLTVLTALLPDGAAATLLKYYTSQSIVPEETDNSVSYLAIAFSGGAWPEDPQARLESTECVSLTVTERQSLLKLARGTVQAYVRDKRKPAPEDLAVAVSEAMSTVLGAFVTLHKYGKDLVDSPGQASDDRQLVPDGGQQGASFAAVQDGFECRRRGERELRGCIGYIWPLKPLFEAVIDNAVSACSTDHRFLPVEAHELEDIPIEISVLTPPRRIGSYHDIVLGRDGIVFFKDGHQSVFLPCVAAQFGWDLERTLTELSRKAGLASDAWREGAKFDVFQAEVIEE